MKRLLTVLWCGWILWAISLKGTTAVEGYDTFAACKASEDRMWDRAKQENSGTAYACFPSDFDPREKK